MRRSWWAGVVSLLIGSLASASPELPPAFDARVVGMGGAATANVENATGVLYNPAALDRVNHLSATLALTPLLVESYAPLNGPDSKVKAKSPIAPLFFLGGAYRFTDRITVGLGAFPLLGGGSKYEDVPLFGGLDPEVAVGAVEGVGVVSVRIIDGLSVAAGLRGTMVEQVVYLPIDLGDGTLATLDSTMTGLNFVGATAGIDWQLTEALRLGFNYRSKITVKVDDDEAILNVNGTEQKVKVKSELAMPHALRLGGSLALLDKRLNLAADVKLLLHQEANRETPVTITTPQGPVTSVTPDDWRNTWSFFAGAEYFFTERFAGRLGYGFLQMATHPRTTSPFSLPPGEAHTFNLGAGLKFGPHSIDLGGFIGFNRYDISATQNPLPGRYGFMAYQLSLSGTVRF